MAGHHRERQGGTAGGKRTRWGATTALREVIDRSGRTRRHLNDGRNVSVMLPSAQHSYNVNMFKQYTLQVDWGLLITLRVHVPSAAT